MIMHHPNAKAQSLTQGSEGSWKLHVHVEFHYERNAGVRFDHRSLTPEGREAY